MYAIVEIGGQQFKVEKDQKLYVHRLEGEEGKKVSFEKVLLIDTGNKIAVGDPLVKGASVAAKIVAHVKGDKVLVFKKKRRKGYKKLNGHRQYFTQIQIETISEKAEAAKPTSRETVATEKPSVTKKPEAKAAAAKKPAAAKTAAEKKSTTQKSEAKPAAKTSTKPAAKTSVKPVAKASAKPAAKPAAKKESGEDNAITE